MLIIFVYLFSFHVFLARTSDPTNFIHPRLLGQTSCRRDTNLLNDCNWCKCILSKYICTHRACNTVDMFGHFNDAIREINVGMEGHGAWRTTETPCEPGVHYKRGPLLCVCNDEGAWPNPVCRDVFRMLYTIEQPIDKEWENRPCSPSKLYLTGCNVCICPSNGKLDPLLCTKRQCTSDDPVLLRREIVDEPSTQETYAECRQGHKYKLDCKTCDCLRNNRLICSNCTNDANTESGSSYCNDKKPNQVFALNCNLCFCDSAKYIYCTTKRCLRGADIDLKTIEFDEPEARKSLVNYWPKLEDADPPVDDLFCTPKTKYKKDCNVCRCNGKGKHHCTKQMCASSVTALDYIKFDCLNATTYEYNCYTCHCSFNKKTRVKEETCIPVPECRGLQKNQDQGSTSLINAHGYCQPLHIYNKDCNSCECLSDGKVDKCTSNICSDRVDLLKEINTSIEIIPVVRDEAPTCPRGSVYKIDCNICLCLSNGNTVCTLATCGNKSR